MAEVLVDIEHICGYKEQGHRVELPLFQGRHQNPIEDHLRVKPCPQCQARGGWNHVPSAGKVNA